MRLSKTTLSLIFTFLLVFGVTIVSQRALGINIGSTLNLGGTNKIIGVPVPTAIGEAANWDFVNSSVASLQQRVTGTCAANQGIQVVNADGTVTCKNAGGTVSSASHWFSGGNVTPTSWWAPLGTSFTLPVNTSSWACTITHQQAPSSFNCGDGDVRIQCGATTAWGPTPISWIINSWFTTETGAIFANQGATCEIQFKSDLACGSFWYDTYGTCYIAQ
jgi:hypothetical protein